MPKGGRMICFGADSHHYYRFDEHAVILGYPIFHIHMQPQLLDKQWVRKPVMVECIKDVVYRVGKIQVEFEDGVDLLDFSSDNRRIRSLEAGPCEFDLLAVDLPGHQRLRNIDLVVLPNTVFGLAWPGLVTTILRQRRWSRSPEVLEALLRKIEASVFEATRQLELPYRDS